MCIDPNAEPVAFALDTKLCHLLPTLTEPHREAIAQDLARTAIFMATAMAADMAQDAVNDVAVLKAEGGFSPVRLVSSSSLTLGADLFTVGFPDVQVQGTAPKLTKGSVSGLLGPGDDPRYFQLSNPIQPLKRAA